MNESINTASGSAGQMRSQEERLLAQGYERVPAITPDEELMPGQYKWNESPPISSLFNTEVVLTWR